MPVIVTIAPTGPIATKQDNPSLPTQPEEIAAEVAVAYQQGASVAHLHFRDREDRPTAGGSRLRWPPIATTPTRHRDHRKLRCCDDRSLDGSH